MIYKLGNPDDVLAIPMFDEVAKVKLIEYANILSSEYGANRDLDKNLGGYILYATEGTETEDIKAVFDYSSLTAEYVDIFGDICIATYILSSDYGVVIIMSLKDAPTEILREINI